MSNAFSLPCQRWATRRRADDIIYYFTNNDLLAVCPCVLCCSVWKPHKTNCLRQCSNRYPLMQGMWAQTKSVFLHDFLPRPTRIPTAATSLQRQVILRESQTAGFVWRKLNTFPLDVGDRALRTIWGCPKGDRKLWEEGENYLTFRHRASSI